MNFLKLNSDQYIELVPRCKCSVISAINDAIEFIKAHELKGADLIYEGFSFGIYPGDFKGREAQFAHELELEFNNWKEKQPKQ